MTWSWQGIGFLSLSTLLSFMWRLRKKIKIAMALSPHARIHPFSRRFNYNYFFPLQWFWKICLISFLGIVLINLQKQGFPLICTICAFFQHFLLWTERKTCESLVKICLYSQITCRTYSEPHFRGFILLHRVQPQDEYHFVFSLLSFISSACLFAFAKLFL